MVDAEIKKIEERREEITQRKKLWFWLLPLLIWFAFNLILLTLKWLVPVFLAWSAIIVIMVVSAALAVTIGVISWFLSGAGAEVSDKLYYLKPEEATERMIEYAKKDKYNPVNLELFQGRRKISSLRTVGSGAEQTEVYVRKFIDSHPVKHDFYYFFMRVNQPDSISYESRKDEPSEIEEEELIKYHAENLALSPVRYRKTIIQRDSPLTGVTEIQTVHEPIETIQKSVEENDGKEDIEG